MVARRMGRLLWWVSAAVIVSLALALSAARLLLPGMGEYRGQVVDLVERTIHRQVEIGAMDAAWYRFSPVLRLQQVVIHDKAFPDGQLDIGEIQVGLDIISSLWQRKWLTSGIRIIGVKLAVQTDLSAAREDALNLDAFYWLMSQKSVSLEKIELGWKDPGLLERAVQFTALSAKLRNDGWRHQLLVKTDINAHYGKHIELAADLSGPLKWPKDWRGKVYLKTDQFHLTSVNRLAKTLGYTIRGDVNLEAWAGIRDRQLKWTAGSIQIDRPWVKRRDVDNVSYAVDTLSSHFSLRALPNGWNMELQHFSLTRHKQTVWPDTRLRAILNSGETLSVHGMVNHVSISETGQFLILLPWIDEAMCQRIQHMQAEGELTDTAFELDLSDKKPPQLSLRSAFSHLGVSSYEGLPAATGLSGSLEGNLQAGNITLDTHASSLHLPKVFSEVLELSRLTGKLHWQRLSDRFRVSSGQLLMESAAFNAQTRLQLDWLPGQAAPWVDVQLHADEVQLVDVKHYLPDRVMRPKALKWLRQAFPSGTARNINFLLQGPLNHVPFDQHDGRLEARFDFDDVQLDYHPLWGQLDALSGSALFAGRSMRITGTSATLLDASVERVVAVIDDFARPVLGIDGTVSGTLESLLAYINYSPLRDKFGKLVDKLTTRGDASLQLELRIPLHPGLGHLKVNGDIDFLGNDLVVNDNKVSLDGVRGVLNFTAHGVTAHDIDAKLFGHPVKVAVYPKGSASQRRTIVDIAGDLELVDKLEKENPKVKPYLKGAAHWNALLQIPEGKHAASRHVRIKLLSDLKGVAIRLPAPFTKASGEKRPVSISWAPGKLSSLPLDIKLGDDVALQVLMRKKSGGLRKAGIHFGEGAASLPPSDVIHLDGWLDSLNLDAWIDLVRDIARHNTLTSNTAPPVSTDLHIREVSLLGYLAQGLKLSSQTEDPWRFTIGGRDMVGQASWTPATGDGVPTLTVRLEKLTAVKEPDTGKAGHKVTLTPERLPNLDLDIGAVQLGPYDLGKVAIQGKRVPEGMDFPHLKIDSPAIAFKGEGAWLQQGKQQSTRFRADITGGELGELVKMFDERGVIEGARMKGHASLDWPGNPASFNLATVEGKISLETGKGRLVEVKEGAGKLLNLFSLNSLQRRLTLDFTDLTKEGFSFDKMAGSMVISDGNAYTEDFVIEGSSAIIEISGRTGLATRDYDQLIKVTPQVSSSLPLAGAIAGGPAVGAAVYLAERLVGKRFNRMAQVRYKVTGSWDKPVYTRLKKGDKPSVKPQPEDGP